MERGLGFIFQIQACHTPSNPFLFFASLTMGKNKRQNLAHLDTTNIHGASDEGQGSVVSGLGDMGDHIEKLKHVASTMQKLANLLGDQLQGLSGTIPVLHGLEIVRA